MRETVQAMIRVATEKPLLETEAYSLYDWLRQESKIRKTAKLSMGSFEAPVPGAQGPLLDLVSLVVGSGFSAASLVVSIATWRDTRPQSPTVTVERDGITVTVGGSLEETQRLMEKLLTGTGSGDDDTDGENGL
ncbi:hypothetical protein ACIRJM_45125 [Streptomyces sp. NPDC102405]|uniref:effector-associated constant component EACC1 n=1 Tax=Streptomyces sp. NPDC102405 TaxID=3366170 RepID=UPI00381A75F6